MEQYDVNESRFQPVDCFDGDWAENDAVLSDLQRRTRERQLRQGPVTAQSELGVLSEMAHNYPLLTGQEERALSELMRSAEGISEDELDPQKRHILWRAKQAKEQFMMSNLPLAINYAKRFAFSAKDSTGELVVALHTEGIRRAVEKFDPAKGFRFSTYATQWLRPVKTKFFRERAGRVISISQDAYSAVKVLRWLRGGGSMYAFDIHPDDLDAEQEMDFLNVGPKQYRRIVSASQIMQGVQSIDGNSSEDTPNIQDVLAPEEDSPEAQALITFSDHTWLDKAYDSMSEKERQVFDLSFDEQKAHVEICEILDIKQTTVVDMLRRSRARISAYQAVDVVAEQTDRSFDEVMHLKQLVSPGYQGIQDGPYAQFIQDTRPEKNQVQLYEQFFGTQAVDNALKLLADIRPERRVEEMVEYRLWRRDLWEQSNKRMIAKLSAREVAGQFDMFFVFTAIEAGIVRPLDSYIKTGS